ncbi:hypothetical protein [Streptomyces griseus]|uniref:hypothetical protein n=1 Tax=Streptomyces griseus TaxID=1911 RepID=UPI0037F90990
MDITMLHHPMVAEAVEALVADGGGLIAYEQGMGGREALVAAAAALAARNNSPLTIVEATVLHDDTRATVARLQPDVRCTVISAQDTALQPPPSPGSVLAVHADLLGDPAVRRPVLELARAADHLLVARHDYSDPALDHLAGPSHRLDYQAYAASTHASFEEQAHQFAPGHVPPPTMEQREGRSVRQDPDSPDPALWWTADLARKRDLIDQLKQPRADRPDATAPVGPADPDAAPRADDFHELIAELETHVAMTAGQRAEELRDRLREGAQERAEAALPPQPPHQHGQAQSAAHQHDTPHGRAPGH